MVKMSALRAGRPLPQEDSWYTFLLETQSTPGLGQLKNPVTSSGIESATFRLVGFSFNKLRCRVPPESKYHRLITLLYTKKGLIRSVTVSICLTFRALYLLDQWIGKWQCFYISFRNTIAWAAKQWTSTVETARSPSLSYMEGRTTIISVTLASHILDLMATFQTVYSELVAVRFTDSACVNSAMHTDYPLPHLTQQNLLDLQLSHSNSRSFDPVLKTIVHKKVALR
jgi:hypothetical protein